ncbi:hypothetical protein [Undibacterium flavidum]|uniref:Uncharacterized protein n=1 Tax=Undibacterium flavidum TaxID=2762297 RepID=A0ABR6YE16_9BURK|nr:hypothetical protein [Undibacterium flavidum]MBC3874809.1 hypothetical protein [Undibacterium flavidum]
MSKLAFGSNNATFLSIFCEAQITSSQTGVNQSQKQSQKQVKNNDLQPLLEKWMSVDTVCFDVAVAFDLVVDFDLHPLLTLPIVLDRKWIKKVALFEP